MYNSYFKFSRRPFVSVPHVERYFSASTIEAARQTLVRCIERGQGAGMVVGPSGIGKTLLCQVLAEQLRQSFRVALLSSGRLSTRRDLFQAILYELGRPYHGTDEGELRLALADYLTASEDCPQGLVLLVDEAHTLPLRLLEEIRMLTNLARDGQPRVRLMLAGGTVLEERFANPKLDSFSQRLVARCYLESFNRTETQNYIHVQIDSAGAAGEAIFSDDTCQSVHQATDGVPRLVNQVCDHALLLAYVGGRRQIEPAHVDEAWADLQQLPTPSNQESREAGGGSDVIEFGKLDDQPVDAEEPSVPPLRISPETGEADESTAEPAEQLERIGQMLANVEEDFQPAGSIKPELELVFDEPEHLLQEKFEADPSDVEVALELAAIYRRDGKLSEASEMLQTTLQASGGDERIRTELAEVQLSILKNNVLIAERRYRDKPEDPQAKQTYQQLAKALIKMIGGPVKTYKIDDVDNKRHSLVVIPESRKPVG